jgi:hypothetical protein
MLTSDVGAVMVKRAKSVSPDQSDGENHHFFYEKLKF